MMLELRRAALLAVLLCACVGLASAPALAKGVRWTATSTASIAITGNITLTANSIRFGNGAVVGLKPTGTPDMFTLDPPGANPVLLHKNLLCGPTPPTYVTLFMAGGSLGFVVYDGPDRPDTPNSLTGLQHGLCAAYFYELH